MTPTPSTARTNSTVGFPPLMQGQPLLGSTLDLFRNPIALFVKAYQELGPIFRVRVPGREYTVLAGPEATLFLAQGGEAYMSSRKVFSKVMQELRTENFIAALEGEAHRHQRKILKPGLSREAINRYIPRMVQATESVASGWQSNQRLRVKPLMQLLVSEQLGLAMMNHALGERFKDAVTFAETLVGAGAAGTWPAIMLRRPAYRAAKARVVSLMRELIVERRMRGSGEQGEREPDLLDVLLAARDLEGKPLTEVDLIVGAQLPYIAGMDTAAATSSFLLYSLLKRPALFEQVTAEVDEAFADGIPNAQTLRQMSTLHAAAMETFRMYPVVSAVPRYAARPFEFHGYRIDVGQRLLISTTTSHFLPRFFPDPSTFDVNRYREPRNEHRQPGAFAPFAAGPHTCVASGLAEIVIMTTVAALLHTVRLELDPPEYVLKTTVNPLPGPEARFHVRVREQREPGVSRLRPARSLTGMLSMAFPLLDRELVTQITPKVALLTYAPGTTIIRQGDPPDKFYIILKGEVEVVREQSGRDARRLARLTEGNYFGEIGLLQGIPRTATVRARDEGEVLLMALDREDFTRMVVESDLTSQEIAGLMRQRVMRTRIAETFPGLSDELVARITAESELVQYTPGVSIMCEGDPAEKFCLLIRGVCDVMSRQPDGEDKVLRQLSAGEYFGEIGLLQGGPQRFTVRAASGSPVEVMELGSATFTTLVTESQAVNEAITVMMHQQLAKLQE